MPEVDCLQAIKVTKENKELHPQWGDVDIGTILCNQTMEPCVGSTDPNCPYHDPENRPAFF